MPSRWMDDDDDDDDDGVEEKDAEDGVAAVRRNNLESLPPLERWCREFAAATANGRLFRIMVGTKMG